MKRLTALLPLVGGCCRMYVAVQVIRLRVNTAVCPAAGHLLRSSANSHAVFIFAMGSHAVHLCMGSPGVACIVHQLLLQTCSVACELRRSSHHKSAELAAALKLHQCRCAGHRSLADCFKLFDAVHQITTTHDAITRITQEVMFLAQCAADWRCMRHVAPITSSSRCNMK